ncbi:gliding motility-associated C-terminal domain-containing protein [Mucilaginibacter arboris]|uniref:T9SS type B sorting domain-containing protein n=1 Tax=Mucilaginibacter arboris TaxID=2682090 RepID=A0A7K1T0K9_9SPHI|nr:gliding motility-associated C-terminal domain-containing protein [Mucilaginibacter arboris]MVN23106.1 T9SS type B sorting domain-containing protein [Mucilaginibacter arboris]
MKFYSAFIGCLILFLTNHVFGQASQCPQNIGFETGDLQNWQCYIGNIDRAGNITVNPSSPVPGRHTVLKYQNNQLDPYGQFPVTCPNGSLYSLKLGNDQTGAQAERVSYTFTVPNNQANYSIIYNYAVVFQNPNHASYEQPKFTARVFDVASNQYVNCGSFEFVASSGLPGFQQSSFGNGVVYKPWAPITINLFGYSGKTLRLEFTTNDCTLGGHFGYAYVDVNENCASPITGNTYCAGNSFLKMSAPAGFKEYYWYNDDFSKVLGTSNTLTISPAPPDQTHYALRIVPFPGLGCEDTLYTTVNASPDILTLNVQDSISGCESGVSLKGKDITAGSSSNLTYSYFTDPDAQNYVPDAEHVIVSGTYYIQAVNAAGCSDIKPIKVILNKAPSILITNPGPVCAPDKVDLTQSKITAGSNSALTYTYWKDKNATVPLTSPQAIDSAGTYYIKGVNTIGCSTVVPVNVVIGQKPVLVVNNVSSCAVLSLTSASVTTGSDPNLTYSYWTDAAATNPLPSPDQITTSGTYYIKAANAAGCSSISPVVAQIFPLPAFKITNPLPVVFPATVDLTVTYTGSNNLTYTYWKDTAAKMAVDNPDAVQKSGIYYIKAATAAGCTLILPVSVIINPPPVVKIIAPNVFTPNGDGTNDFFKFSFEGVLQLNYLKIYNRYGQQVFETKQLTDYWDGTFNGSKAPVGAYYWVLEGSDSYRKERVVKSGSITLIR